MNKLKTAIRILTIVSFLAPFVTCNNSGAEKTATAVQEDFDTVAGSPLFNVQPGEDTTLNLPAPATTKSFWDAIISRIIFPTDDSVSGFGTALGFREGIPSILTATSFVLSVFLLFPWKFLSAKKSRLYLVLLNLLCIILFISYILLFDPRALLWGAWLLTALILSELIVELKTASTTLANQPG